MGGLFESGSPTYCFSPYAELDAMICETGAGCAPDQVCIGFPGVLCLARPSICIANPCDGGGLSAGCAQPLCQGNPLLGIDADSGVITCSGGGG
jgi:hypothetical protein